MGCLPDTLIRNAYLQSRDEVVDVSVRGGQIERIAANIDDRGNVEIDADGNLVTSGFVDAHVHLDQALSQAGGRKPSQSDDPFEMDRALRSARRYFTETPRDELTENAIEVGRQAVANGILHLRAHTYVDPDVGAKAVRAIDTARERLSDSLDIEIVAFPQQGVLEEGTEQALREGMRCGADLVGGIDPASRNENVTRTVSTWFDVATDHDADIDVHLHDRGTLGLYTVERIIDRMHEYGYEGRVTASHAYALADAAAETGTWISDADLDRILRKAVEARLQFVTCYLTTKPAMPVEALQDEEDIAFGHGSDQVCDMWSPHGNIEPIEEAFGQSQKLRTDESVNDHIDRIWRLLTEGGAAVCGLGDYGVTPGTPADLIVHGDLSRQWIVLKQSTPQVVLKNGRVVSRDGEFVG